MHLAILLCGGHNIQQARPLHAYVGADLNKTHSQKVESEQRYKYEEAGARLEDLREETDPAKESGGFPCKRCRHQTL